MRVNLFPLIYVVWLLVPPLAMDESDLHLFHWSCLVLLLVFVVDGGAAAWAGAYAWAWAWAWVWA